MPGLITSHDLGCHLHDSFSGEILSQWRAGGERGRRQAGRPRGSIALSMMFSITVLIVSIKQGRARVGRIVLVIVLVI